MNFPAELWSDEQDRRVVLQAVELLVAIPLVLTDKLTNSVYFNAPAEELFCDSGEAIVNRAAFSLLGFGSHEKMPPGLPKALLGECDPWRGIVHPDGGSGPIFCEASTARRQGRFLCGILRFTPRT